MLDNAKFFSLFSDLKPFEDRPTIAIAVSGGRDSLCLCILVSKLLEKIGGSVVALTVNHNSMEEDFKGVEQTKKWLEAYSNVSVVEILLPKTKNHSEKYWRDIRYQLTLDYCKNNNILHLMLGHQYDDQLETIAMRSKRSSSGIGLSGMYREFFYDNLRIIRPFLSVSRAEITHTLRMINQSWVDDPVNDDFNYERSRTRIINKDLIDFASKNAENFHSYRINFESKLLEHLAKNIVLITKEGAIEISAVEDVELNEYAIQKLIMTVGGLSYPVPISSCRDIINKGHGTLGNCLIRQSGGVLRIERELRNLPKLMSFSGELIWDNRFKLVGSGEVIANSNAYPEAVSGKFEIYFSPKSPIFSQLFN